MADNIDINKLVSILDVNKTNGIPKNLSMELFSQYTKQPKYGLILLNIACDSNNNYSSDVSQNASIQLKNYISSYWRNTSDEKMNIALNYDNEEIIIISDEDKNFIRTNILKGFIYIVEKENISVLKQLTQCIKKILKYDFKQKDFMNEYINIIMKCLDSQNQNTIYGGVILFHQLSKIFEHEDKDNKDIYNEYFSKVNDKLLYIINEAKYIKSYIEAKFLYKIVKIFLKNFQGNIIEVIQKDETYLFQNFDKNNPKSITFWKRKI